MWHGLKIGAAMVVVAGLVMSALAVARAADEPASDGQRIGAEQLILEALAPLLDDGTLTGEQAEFRGGVEHEEFIGVCPDCGSQLEFAEGCVKCHVCGFSECG